MEKRSKIESYIGFALRAGKVRGGVNAIGSLRGRVPLLIVCATASDNTKSEAVSLSRKLGAKLVISRAVTVEKLIGKENCKLAAITDKNLAKAIIDNLDDEFELFGGNKF